MIRHSICSDCYMYCHLEVDVVDGRISGLRGDPEDPVYRGGICIKGANAHEVAYSPQRITSPLWKEGGREAGEWVRITWPEALTRVADRLERIIRAHGPKAVVAFTGYPGTSRCIMSTLFTRSLGSPDIVSTTPLWCEGPGMVADHVTVGGPITHFAYHDLDHSRCYLLWGTNPQASHPPYWKKIVEGCNRGAKLIVVDPRKTTAAGRADVWLPVRPGTDGALALGMMHVIINEELYDTPFIKAWCYGFEQLREHVQKYPPGEVERITGVPAERLVQAARLYATTKPACMFARNGLTRKPNATQACRGITLLVALSGNIDVQGGNLLPKRLDGFVSRGEMVFGKAWRLPEEIEAEARGAREFPLWTGPNGVGASSNNSLVIDEMLSDHSGIRGAIVTGNNYALNTPDPQRVREAFRRLDLIVAVDCFQTPTTELADVFLPAVTWLEREEIGPEWHSLHIPASERAIEPLGEAWDDNKIFIELAKEMRARELLPYNFIPWNSVEAFLDFQVHGLRMSFDDLKKRRRLAIPIRYKAYEEHGFNTPSGKVELYSTLLERYGYEPLPVYHELPQVSMASPDPQRAYPLQLIAPREAHFFNSRQRHSPSLRKTKPEATVEIHQRVAAERGIQEGDWVWIETGFGRCKQRARVTDNVPPDVVSAYGYWWYPEKPAPDYGCFESNISMVIPDGPPYDPIEGTSWLIGRLCEVWKVEE